MWSSTGNSAVWPQFHVALTYCFHIELIFVVFHVELLIFVIVRLIWCSFRVLCDAFWCFSRFLVQALIHIFVCKTVSSAIRTRFFFCASFWRQKGMADANLTPGTPPLQPPRLSPFVVVAAGESLGRTLWRHGHWSARTVWSVMDSLQGQVLVPLNTLASREREGGIQPEVLCIALLTLVQALVPRGVADLCR